MPTPLLFLPQPQSISYQGGILELAPTKLIVIPSPAYLFPAYKLQTSLISLGLNWEIVVDSAEIPRDQVGVTLSTASMPNMQPNSYMLSIGVDGIELLGGRESLWYAVCTLMQILQQTERQLPYLTITDWPDFPRRGVMLDISRDKVPTIPTLLTLIDKLASWKINEIQLYTEHTFAYRRHKTVWADASPLTGEEIMHLDQFCRDRYIDLVPNQNSFGHMHRWLMHDEYRHLAEVPEGLDWPSLLTHRPFTLAPTDPGSIKLIGGLYDELLPHFTSRYFNVGCDETFDLGQGRSKELVESKGKGRVYLDFVKQIAELVRTNNRTMMFWGDIIIKYPDLVKELPPDLIPMEWGYDANHPFEENGAAFAQAGLKFYVCPGTSSWLSMLGRTDNAIANLRNAAVNGKKHGATGYLITDWGDYGHWQPLPVSYLGFAYGAGLSWAVEANTELDLPAVLNHFAFEDPFNVTGQVVYDLGLCYKAWDEYPHSNAANMVRALYTPLEKIKSTPWLPGTRDKYDKLPITPSKVKAAIDCLEATGKQLSNANPADPLVVPEYWLAMGLWRHGCERLLLAAGDSSVNVQEMKARLLSLRGDYRTRWLARNRPGGLTDSLTRMDRLVKEYEDAGA